MLLKVRQRKETREIEQEGKCMCVNEREKKGDLMQLDLVLQVLQCSDKTFMSQKGWIPKLSWKEAFQANKKSLESDIMFSLYIQVWNRKQKVKRRPSGTFHHHGQQRICHRTTRTPSGRVSLITVVQMVKGRSASEEAALLTWRGWISDAGHAECGYKGQRSKATRQGGS